MSELLENLNQPELGISDIKNFPKPNIETTRNILNEKLESENFPTPKVEELSGSIEDIKLESDNLPPPTQKRHRKQLKILN